MQSREIFVRVGPDKVPVKIDSNTTAGDIKRMLGKPDMALTINGNTVGDRDKVMPLLSEGDNDIRLVPKATVGWESHPFSFRLKQEETLMREIGFYPVDGKSYVGSTVIGGDIVNILVLVPETFPYSQPRIIVQDRDFLGLHHCIIPDSLGARIHFRDNQWRPDMHIADLTMNAIAFLKGLETRYKMRKFTSMVRRLFR